MITLKLKLFGEDLELTVAEAKDLHAQLDEVFGKPAPRPYQTTFTRTDCQLGVGEE